MKGTTTSPMMKTMKTMNLPELNRLIGARNPPIAFDASPGPGFKPVWFYVARIVPRGGSAARRKCVSGLCRAMWVRLQETVPAGVGLRLLGPIRLRSDPEAGIVLDIRFATS